MKNKFLGQSVVITGACGGLGQAFARTFKDQDAQLVLLDRDSQRLDEMASELGGSIQTVVYDQADAASIEKAVASIGRIGVLVNNAAYMVRKPLLEMDQSEVRHLIDVDLTGSILMAMAAAKRMKSQGGGVIVNVASQLAFTSEPERAIYSTAKAGLVQFTRSSAREWIEHGIRTFAIAPGVVKTNMTDSLSSEAKQLLLSRVPNSVIIQPQEIANLVAFIASIDGASIVGQTLVADNGYLIH